MIAVRVMGPMKVAVVGAPEYFAQQSPHHARPMTSRATVAFNIA
jgi:hypothetical protein